jgi:hypothetical protein
VVLDRDSVSRHANKAHANKREDQKEAKEQAARTLHISDKTNEKGRTLSRVTNIAQVRGGNDSANGMEAQMRHTRDAPSIRVVACSSV